MKHTKTIAVIGMRGFPGVQGGVEMHCQNIYTRMPLKEYGARAVIYRRKPYLTTNSATGYPDIDYVDLPSTRIKGVEAVVHTLLCVCHIACHRPDVVHIHNIGPGMVAPLLRILGLRVVMTYHSANYEHSKWGPMAKRLLKLCERISLKWSNEVIFVNKFRMQKYPLYIRQKSCYIPNGIAQGTTRSNATDYLLHKGIEPGHYLLSVGRLTPEKGFEYLIMAAQQSADIKQVVIAGASDHGSDYADRLKQLDTKHKVIFTGFTSGEDLRQLYSHAKLYVLPSINEGFPLVLLEAMSYGLPVAASDIPAAHLIELPCDRYFKPADPADMLRTINHCLKTDNGPVSYDLTDYDWQQIARTTFFRLLPQRHIPQR